MDPKEFIDTRTKRYMAQALEKFEQDIEGPLTAAIAREPRSDLSDILASLPGVKREFRKKLQALGGDAIDLAPRDLQINGFEPIARR